METPKYKHDCAKCTFLESVIVENVTYDCYICNKGLLGGSIVARYGDKGEEYTSAPISLFTSKCVGSDDNSVKFLKGIYDNNKDKLESFHNPG